MPKENSYIKQITQVAQQEIMDSLQTQGLQPPSNLSKPILAVEGEATAELFLTKLATSFTVFDQEEYSFEQGLEALVYTDSDCGLWPVLAERSEKFFSSAALTKDTISARINNGLVFIVDCPGAKEEPIYGRCYEATSVSTAIPAKQFKAILAPEALVDMVKRYFPTTYVIGVGSVTHNVNLELSLFHSLANPQETQFAKNQTSAEITGPDFYRGIERFLNIHPSMSKIAVHALRLPTTDDLEQHPTLFPPIVSYQLSTKAAQEKFVTWAIEEHHGIKVPDQTLFFMNSERLIKPLRERLKLDRLSIKLTASELEHLQTLCPTATIEEDWKQKGRKLITFDKDDRSVIEFFLKKTEETRLKGETEPFKDLIASKARLTAQAQASVAPTNGQKVTVENQGTTP